MEAKYKRGAKTGVREIEVSITIPPGDYSKINDKNEMQLKLSSDMAEFMQHVPDPTMFYVIMKQYFSERKNLHKIICNSLKEACVHSTIVGAMTYTANIAVNEDMDSKKAMKRIKNMKKALQTLRDVLKSKSRIKDWDEFCTSMGEVTSGTYSVENQSDSDYNAKLDTHLKAES